MYSDNWAWHCGFYVFVTLFVQFSSGNSYREPIPLSRCERSIPVYQIIPAALLPGGSIVPIESMNSAVIPTLKRVPRQRQSSIVQQVVVNQNANQQTIPITIGGGGGGGDFDSGFGAGFSGRRRPFFGRPIFGHSFARTYSDPESSSTSNSINAPPCSKSFIISCQPRLLPAPCSNVESGDCAGGASY